MMFRIMRSTNPKKKDTMNTDTITTAVEPMTSLRPGQLTFPSSARTSLKNRIAFLTHSRIYVPDDRNPTTDHRR